MSGPTISSQPRRVGTWPLVARREEITAAVSRYVIRGGAFGNPATVASSNPGSSAVLVKPADWQIYERRLLWIYDVWLLTADTSPGTTLTFDLARLTGLTGAGANFAQAQSISAAVPGSVSAALNAPANSVISYRSSELLIEDDGLYVLTLTTPAAFAVNSGFYGVWSLAVRAV